MSYKRKLNEDETKWKRNDKNTERKRERRKNVFSKLYYIIILFLYYTLLLILYVLILHVLILYVHKKTHTNL